MVGLPSEINDSPLLQAVQKRLDLLFHLLGVSRLIAALHFRENLCICAAAVTESKNINGGAFQP